MHSTPASDPRLVFRLAWEDIDPAHVQKLIELACDEDLRGSGLLQRPDRQGDVTTRLMPEGATGSAELVAREPLVLAGLPLAALVLRHYHQEARLESSRKDGERVGAGEIMGTLRGPATALLQAERVVLNFLQMLSGIATETRRYADALAGSSTRLLDTRKTHPGYRTLIKYATACGGGWNHRIGLFDRVMLKDNHLAVAGAIAGGRLTDAVRAARETYPDLLVEVEVDAPDQIAPALEAGAHIILLDNFSDNQLRQAVRQIAGRAFTEASGGITFERLPRIARTGVDFVSTGATVHRAQWVDIGLDWNSSPSS